MKLKLKVATNSSTQNLRKPNNYSEKNIWGSVALREIFCLNYTPYTFLCVLCINIYNFSVELPFASVAQRKCSFRKVKTSLCL